MKRGKRKKEGEREQERGGEGEGGRERKGWTEKSHSFSPISNFTKKESRNSVCPSFLWEPPQCAFSPHLPWECRPSPKNTLSVVRWLFEVWGVFFETDIRAVSSQPPSRCVRSQTREWKGMRDRFPLLFAHNKFRSPSNAWICYILYSVYCLLYSVYNRLPGDICTSRLSPPIFIWPLGHFEHTFATGWSLILCADNGFQREYPRRSPLAEWMADEISPVR